MLITASKSNGAKLRFVPKSSKEVQKEEREGEKGKKGLLILPQKTGKMITIDSKGSNPSCKEKRKILIVREYWV